jgi:hypothetical protein
MVDRLMLIGNEMMLMNFDHLVSRWMGVAMGVVCMCLPLRDVCLLKYVGRRIVSLFC